MRLTKAQLTQIIKEELRNALLEQKIKPLVYRPQTKLKPRIYALNVGPDTWQRSEEVQEHRKSFEKIRKEFIHLNIIQKQEQIFKAAASVAKSAPNRKQKSEILSNIINFTKDTKIKFILSKSPGFDPDYRGPAEYSATKNLITVSEFRSYWLKQGSPYWGRWPWMVRHELGHTKDAALSVAFNKYMASVGSAGKKEKYFRSRTDVLAVAKKCFPSLKHWSKAKKHHEYATEFYASLQEMFSLLGRNYLRPEDVQLYCAHKAYLRAGRGDKSYKQLRDYERIWRDTIRRPRGETMYSTQRKFIENEVWKSFNCAKCSPKTTVRILNDLARLDIKNIPQTTPLPQAHALAEHMKHTNIADTTIHKK